MPYPPSGNLQTNYRQIAVSETWDTDSDWNANQSISNITVSGGSIQLTETATIPGSIVLLDDWADGNLTSNREDYNTTDFQPSTSNLVQEGATGSLSRPAWTIDRGTPFTQTVNGKPVVTVRTSSGTGDKIRRGLSLTSLDGCTWEFGVEDIGETIYLNITANSTTYRTSASNLEDGYVWSYGGTQSYNFFVDNGGSTTSLVSGSTPTPPFVCRIENRGGTWEVFYDGTSDGTATDTSITSSTYTQFGSNDGISAADIDVNFYAVDDGS